MGAAALVQPEGGRMKGARIMLTPELLLSALHLPSETAIRGVCMSGRLIQLDVEHDGLRDGTYAENEQWPIVTPEFVDYHGRTIFRGWGQ